jgi:hypothetical protein
MVDRFKISIEDGVKNNELAENPVKKNEGFRSKKFHLLGFVLLICLVLLMLSIFYFAKSSKSVNSIQINFQDSVTIPPSGWLRDFGQAFGPRTSSYQGQGKTYGWIKRSDKTPVDLTRNGRKRNFPSDILFATLMVMQGNNINNFTGTPTEGIWEAQVTNGNYDVTVSVGDGTWTDSRNCINIEGVSVIADFVPTTTARFKSATVTVTVSDEYLTIDAIGGNNTKINTVIIRRSASKDLR